MRGPSISDDIRRETEAARAFQEKMRARENEYWLPPEYRNDEEPPAPPKRGFLGAVKRLFHN